MLIRLAEWAEKVGLKANSARRRALRQTIPAVKIGRDWWIDSEAQLLDYRQYPYCYGRKHGGDPPPEPVTELPLDGKKEI